MNNSPTPKADLPWLRNNEYDGFARPHMLVGDRFLIAVPLHANSGGGYELSVIVADETGFNDAEGDAWGAWDWSDVEWYVPLDGVRTTKDVEELE